MPGTARVSRAAPGFQMHAEIMTQPLRRGLFRTNLPGIGECARVDMRAGDAAPYLEREMYVLLGFQPAYESLPERPASAPATTQDHLNGFMSTDYSK